MRIDARTVVLQILSRGDVWTASQVSKRVQDTIGGRMAISRDAVFGALAALVRDGLASVDLRSEARSSRNAYEITDAGRLAARVDAQTIRSLLHEPIE